MIPGNKQVGVERLRKLREHMEASEIDAMVIFSNHNNYYVSGFLAGCPEDIFSWLYVTVVPVDGEPVFLVPVGEELHAKDHDIPTAGQSWIEDVRIYRELDVLAAAKVLNEKKYKKIGLEMGAIGFSASRYIEFKKSLQDAAFIDITTILEEMRMIKSETEVEVIKKSADIACVGALAGIETINVGKNEFEVIAEAEYAMKRHLAKKYPEAVMCQIPTTPSFCSSGPRTLIGIQNNYGRTIRSGDSVITMNYALYDGYWAEIERTVLVGNVPKEKRELYEAMIECRIKIIDSLYPGIRCSDLAKMHKEYFEKAGYGKYTYEADFIGHCNGIHAHEKPDISLHTDATLKEGMAFCLEPGLYHPKLGGVRHSDQFIMTKKGAERLSSSVPWDLYK